MKKFTVAVTVFIVALTAVAYAQTTGKEAPMSMHQHSATPAAQTATPAGDKIVNAGNKTCPLTGDPVSGSDFVDYKGARYGLCCASCKTQFLKDPEKYISKLREKGEIK